MSYKVIHFFTDLKDAYHPYKVGDKFPRDGMKVSEARLKELSSENNRQGKPLIELVEQKTENLQKQYTKTEINRMPTAELKEVAKNNGIKNAENMKGFELKVMLIKYFDL